MSVHSDGIEAAKECFKENLKLLGNSEKQPEKYNLYNGLLNLAIAVELIEGMVLKIERQLHENL